MRIGRNPNKNILDVSKPMNITVALLVYIPNFDIYYRESLNILELVIKSIRRNTSLEYDLMVFDNGSASRVVNYLISEKRSGRIQYLILSEKNLGKVGAWNIMFTAAPGNYIAYADSDVFFYDGWLEAHIDILETFPNVGMVTGLPMRHLTYFKTEATLQYITNTPDIVVERGNLIPHDAIRSFCLGVQKDIDTYLIDYKDIKDISVTYNNTKAFVGASHFQFVARKSILQSLVPMEVSRPLYKMETRQLDSMIDAAGLMKLSTSRQYVYHLGNKLTWEWHRVARQYGATTQRGSTLWKIYRDTKNAIRTKLWKVKKNVLSIKTNK